MSRRRIDAISASRVLGPGSRRIVTASTAAAVAVAAGGLLAGCGGSRRASTATTPAATTSAATTARAADAEPTTTVSAKLRAQEAAMHRQVQRALSHHSTVRYGGIPAALRAYQKAPANHVLDATLARPSDGIQGVPVRLHLGSATALGLGIGPYIPVKYQGTFDLHTPATWTVTFSRVHGRFPLAQRMFSLTTEKGQVLKPTVTTADGRPLPRTVPAGRPFTVRLKSELISEGDGQLRYMPMRGRLLAQWDFDVETD